MVLLLILLIIIALIRLNLKKIKSGFKRIVSWNKYQSKVLTQTQNQYLDYYLFDPCFQGVNGHFVLSFENDVHRTAYKRYFVPTVEIKDYNVVFDGKNFFVKMI